MDKTKHIKRKLQKEFSGRVDARESRGCVILEGSLDNWQDIVRTGRMAVNRKRYLGVINNITLNGNEQPVASLPELRDGALEGAEPDVLVIGGGVIGCAVARELARNDMDILLVEKEHDIAMHASSRNDGMVHPGIDLKKGSEKYKYNMLGNAMYDQVCKELHVDFKRTGQYLCFRKSWWKPLLHVSKLYWKWLGLPAEVLGGDNLREREPNLSEKINAALFFPTAGIVCPYNLAIAYAENAVDNGVRLSLDTAVLGMAVHDGRIQSVHTNRGVVYPKAVVNAAGVFCDQIAEMADDRFYTIHPRKGTNSILDKKFSDSIVYTIVSSIDSATVRTSHSKGGGIVRTVDGNLLIGPDAMETFEREDYSTERQSVSNTFAKQKRASCCLDESEIITYFSGIRAPTYEEDFVVCKGVFTKNIVHAAGIQSPGLTAAPAIGESAARLAVELVSETKEVRANKAFNPIRPRPPRPSRMPDAERAALIAREPDYGVILCRCEEVSRGEILYALRRPVPCDTVDGVKRRARPGMGRCQGGFCGPLVMEVIAGEKELPLSQVKKSGAKSWILYGETKGK